MFSVTLVETVAEIEEDATTKWMTTAAHLLWSILPLKLDIRLRVVYLDGAQKSASFNFKGNVCYLKPVCGKIYKTHQA